MPLPQSLANQKLRQSPFAASIDLLWLEARNRSTNAIEGVGFCSDELPRSMAVILPSNGAVVTRAWYGAGALISISEIAATLSISVQTVQITMSGLDPLTLQAMRGYDPKLAPVEIYQAPLNPDTNQQDAPAECIFYGIINEMEFKSPEDGGEETVELTVVDCTQEFARNNPEMRSHESQTNNRDAADAFYSDAATVGDWEHFWGKKGGKVNTSDSGNGSERDRTSGNYSSEWR